MRAITFPKTSDGIWTNRETGIIVRIELDGSGYRPMRPTQHGTWIGISVPVRTLAEAKARAGRYVRDSFRQTIATAYAEAVAEHIERAAKRAEDAGAPTWRADAARRAVSYDASPFWLKGAINDVRFMEESTADHVAGIERDYAEALQIDKGYPSGQARAWRERVYRRAVEMDAANVHMGNAHDSLIEEAHAEALEIEAEAADIKQQWADALHAEALNENALRDGYDVASEKEIAARACTAAADTGNHHFEFTSAEDAFRATGPEGLEWCGETRDAEVHQPPACGWGGPKGVVCTLPAGHEESHESAPQADRLAAAKRAAARLNVELAANAPQLSAVLSARDLEPPAGWDPEPEQTAEDTVHYWPAAAGNCPPELLSDESSCGVNIMTTSYTFGSPEWHQVNCGQCLTTQPPVEIGKMLDRVTADPPPGLSIERVTMPDGEPGVKLAAAPVPPAPADVDDNAAWAEYVAALPVPSADETARVLAEFGNPYAVQMDQARDLFREAARNIWHARRAGTLTDQTYRTQRAVMGTARMCVQTYRALARSWAYGALAGQDAASSN